jgi:GDPmannose 4,6-dehydratase
VGCSWEIPIQTFDANATGVLRCLEAIRRFNPKCRFYSAGSSEEFGDVQYAPQNITHPIRPRSPYGASKASARHLVKVYRESYNLYAVHGILFNHEGTKRGEEFVTRKISKGVARIYNAIKNDKAFEPINLGNLDAKRDWSDSEDFVDGVWKMLNQETPKDYVLSSNETHSIRELVELAFLEAGIDGVWHGSGINEEYSVSTKYAISKEPVSSALVKINEKFYRPAEVDLLMGDSTPARQELGWSPKVDFKSLVQKMVAHDISLLDKSS